MSLLHLTVNISVSITAFLGNTLILVALQKEPSLHPPSKLLYRNLAITDLCVGMIAEPVYVGRTCPRVTGGGWRVAGDGWRVAGGG